jgi:hypothetical protein
MLSLSLNTPPQAQLEAHGDLRHFGSGPYRLLALTALAAATSGFQLCVLDPSQRISVPVFRSRIGLRLSGFSGFRMSSFPGIFHLSRTSGVSEVPAPSGVLVLSGHGQPSDRSLFRCSSEFPVPSGVSVLSGHSQPSDCFSFRCSFEFLAPHGVPTVDFRLFRAFRNPPSIDLPVGKSSAFPAGIDLPVGTSSALPAGIDLAVGTSSALAAGIEPWLVLRDKLNIGSMHRLAQISVN